MGVLDHILSPRLGLSKHLGTLWAADRKPGVEVIAMGDQIVMHIYKGDEKFYTLELSADAAFKFADLINRGAVYVSSAGGSAAAPRKTGVLFR